VLPTRKWDLNEEDIWNRYDVANYCLLGAEYPSVLKMNAAGSSEKFGPDILTELHHILKTV
jgi:hypothetical protein